MSAKRHAHLESRSMQFHRIPKKSASLPIVSMIDILFILVIFVVVTTNVKRPQHRLNITLPVAKDMPTENSVQDFSVIGIDGNGTIALEGANVPNGLLDAYLEVWKKQNPSRKLEIEADEKAPFGKMIEVWGALTKQGIEVMPTRARVSGEK